MVVHDDKKWITRLIRTAFSIEDDTGICEKVLREKPYLGPGYEYDSESLSSNESFEIREGADIGHRRRSNTAIRLEKLDKQRKAQTETQFIKVNPSETGKNDLHFERDMSYKEKSKTQACAFSVKKLIESVPDPAKIPYLSYSKFESSCHPTQPYKKIAIFLPFLDSTRRNFPLRVGIVSSARIEDLIGLTLWLTSQNYPDVHLSQVHHYKLMIADEDSDYDEDFPPLDPAELVAKFSFSHLALVKITSGTEEHPRRYKPSISFLLPNKTTFKLSLEDTDITVGHLINILLHKSGWSKNNAVLPGSTNVSYYLEKLGDPSVKFLDPLLPFSQCKCKDFCLVRSSSKSVQKADKSVGTKSTADRTTNLYPVMVSTGRFNKQRKCLCVLYAGDKMELELNHKTKSYPLSAISGVKFDSLKNRIVVSLSQAPSTSSTSHYLSTSTQLTFTTAEHRTASELYQHLNSILTRK